MVKGPLTWQSDGYRWCSCWRSSCVGSGRLGVPPAGPGLHFTPGPASFSLAGHAGFAVTSPEHSQHASVELWRCLALRSLSFGLPTQINLTRHFGYCLQVLPGGGTPPEAVRNHQAHLRLRFQTFVGRSNLNSLLVFGSLC